MAKFTVDIPDSAIAKAKNDEVKSLNAKVARLVAKIQKLERQMEEDKDIVKRARAIVEAVNDNGGLLFEEDCKARWQNYEM